MKQKQLNANNFKPIRYAFLNGKLKYYWHIDLEKFETELINLTKSLSKEKTHEKNIEIVNKLFDIIFDATTTAGINIFGKFSYFFDSTEPAMPYLAFKRLMIKHALRSHCILTSLCSIIHTPSCSQRVLPLLPKYWPLYCSGAFTLYDIYQTVQKTAKSKKEIIDSQLAKKCQNLLKIEKISQPSSDDIRNAKYHIHHQNDSHIKRSILKKGIQQLTAANTADSKKTSFISIADAYWVSFLLYDIEDRNQMYERSLNAFINSTNNYPVNTINILQDLIRVEDSFLKNLPGAFLNRNEIEDISAENLKKYSSCDFLLNYMRFEQTFSLRYYIDALAILYNKNPKEIYSESKVSPMEKDEAKRYSDTARQCIHQLDAFPNDGLIKLFSYLDTMPNAFSKMLFLSYAFDCYYMLENPEHNYTVEPKLPSSLIFYRKPSDHMSFKDAIKWLDLISDFLIYINKELLPVFTDLWQTASDYIDCCLPQKRTTFSKFEEILISYADTYKEDLLLDFASISTKSLNKLAAEFKHQTFENNPESDESWNYFQNIMISKIKDQIAESDKTSENLSGLPHLKQAVKDYKGKNKTFAKEDLYTIEQLIIKTQQIKCNEDPSINKNTNSFSDMLSLRDSLFYNENFYDTEDATDFDDINIYRTNSHYLLSTHYFESETKQFTSRYHSLTT